MSYNGDISPARAVATFGRWLPAIILVVVVIGGVVFAGWQSNWWFTAHNATRQAQAIQNGYSNQSTLRAQVTSKLADVAAITTQIAAAKDGAEVTALKDQRAAIAGIACSDAAQVTGTPLPADQARWVSANCSDGSVSPGSTLYVAGAP